MFYRLAQLGRSYWLLNSVYHGSAPAWLFGVLSFLTFFWVYDTGVVLSFLPWYARSAHTVYCRICRLCVRCHADDLESI